MLLGPDNCLSVLIFRLPCHLYQLREFFFSCLSSCAVPHKPDGFSNLVNSLRWAAMVPKVGSNVDKEIVIEAADHNTTLVPNVLPQGTARKVLNYSSNGVGAGDSVAHVTISAHEDPTSGSNELPTLLDPEDAYRTLICIVILFGAVSVIHACKLLTSLSATCCRLSHTE